MRPQFFFKTVTLILTDDLDFGNKEKCFTPRNIYVNENCITYQLKAMSNIKVFADKQMDQQTDLQAKNYMPPIYQSGA